MSEAKARSIQEATCLAPAQVNITTSPSRSPASPPPAAPAQDGSGATPTRPAVPASPALSTASTIDGEEDIDSLPALPPLPAPRLPDRALELLRTPPPGFVDDNQFGTASWGSPYPQSDRNLRRQSFSSEGSDDSPIHQLDIETPYLRPVPELQSQVEPPSSVSAAAAVLANRARRPTLGLTEDWIRTHTTDDLHNSESRHWFSDGSGSEHSSLSGSEPGWQEEGDFRTPRAVQKTNVSREGSRHHPRARSSIETLKAEALRSPKTGQNSSMATSEAAPATHDAASDRAQAAPTQEAPVADTHKKRNPSLNGDSKLPSTPRKGSQKPLPKEPKNLTMTPRPKKKVPWRGKNIMVLLPRDQERGGPGNAPIPLRQHEIQRMFDSWQELGYDIEGFDLEVEGYQPEGTHDSQTRDSWPNFDEVDQERAQRTYKVTLPDLNAWKEYENELQEAKLRALGVSFGDDPPLPSVSPITTDPSRQPSVQYPPLPFSPPIPTSSASSSHALQGFPLAGQFIPGRSSAGQSPALPQGASPGPFGAPGKYNPRQSISFPASASPFMPQSQQGWAPSQAGILQGLSRHDSPTMMNLNGMMSPQSPFGVESPGFNMHQRHQSLQYPMLPHQQSFPFLQQARASPRLQEVREDEEEQQPPPQVPSKSPSKTPEPPLPQPQQQQPQQNPEGLQAEIDDAEYHLEEQLRNQLEHEDYNPQPQGQAPVPTAEPFVPAHERQASEHFPVPERFANEPSKPLVLHHPRPHSRGHSLSQPYFRDQIEAQAQEKGDEGSAGQFRSLNEIPEAQKPDESYEIETNPSNLGTPVQDFEFSTAFGGHQKSFSTASNPWNDAVSANDDAPRRSSHSSKPSLSKLNVQAPEFKFNPGQNSFAPAKTTFEASKSSFDPTKSSFDPTKSSFDPTKSTFVPTASTFNPRQGAFNPGQSTFNPATSSFNPTQSTFTPGQSFNPTQSSFTPGQSSFNPTQSSFAPDQFSFSGANFQPSNTQPVDYQPTVFQAAVDNSVSSPPANPLGFVTPAKINANAPSFSPGQSDFSFSASGPKFNPDAPTFTPLSDSFASPVSEPAGNRGSIFGSIDLTTSAALSSKRTKVVPVLEPKASSPMAKSPRVEIEFQEDHDGRLIDESRFKRAKSSAHDGDDVPLFAEQPKHDDVPYGQPKSEEQARDEPSGTDAEHALPIDTSLSSITSNQMDTKATTATPSESSPGDEDASRWEPFEFRSKDEIQNFNDARPFGEDEFRHGHKKTLSAAAQPFVPGGGSYGSYSQTDNDQSNAELDVSPIVSPVAPARSAPGLGASRFSSGQSEKRNVSGLSSSRFADKPKGLAASRFAKSPSPEQQAHIVDPVGDLMQSVELEEEAIPMSATVQPSNDVGLHEPTFEEIDAVMDQFIDDPSMGVNKLVDVPEWQQASPARNLSLAAVANSPYRLEPGVEQYTRDEASLTPREYHALPAAAAQPMLGAELEDPFVDPPELTRTPEDADADSQPPSDWDGAFTEDEHEKLENRAQFFDGRVNEVVGTLLAARLEPLEKSLFSIQQVLATTGRARRTPSSRRDMRSVSAELQPSDADDEDDEEPIPRRSMSPRRDRRFDQIRVAVMEALNAQQRNGAAVSPPVQDPAVAPAAIMAALDDMKLSLDSKVGLGDELRRVIEAAVESRIPAAPKPEELQSAELDEMRSKLLDLEHKLYFEQTKVENEVAERRAAEDFAAELMRKLQAAETRAEIETINRTVFDQRIRDLEERVRTSEKLSEDSVNARRIAEDSLTEARCRHEAAAEDAARLRESLEQRDQKLRSVEQASGKSAMRMALLEATQNNNSQAMVDMTNKCNAMDTELRDVRQDNHHWRAEFERADESSRQRASELRRAQDENQHMQKSLATLTTQLEENDRLRETWRGKFISLQEDMGKAAREIAEDNARRIKTHQAMIARQEVLDARLQAEAKTRERLEVEMERLQDNERSGMRAVNECKRLEGIIEELKMENHKLEQSSKRFQREFEEARESGVSEVKRTRMALQSEVDSANNQVNVIREELEEQNSKLRSELDSVKLEVDTVKAQNEMFLEEVETTKSTEIEELSRKHQNEIEDLQTRHERQVSNAQEDAHSTERRLLERLSLSASKTEHLQDRILHLEDKLEIAKQAAAAAAAQAAKSVRVESAPAPAPVVSHPRSAASNNSDAPEKISPQALRESIMVLQEQLQAREQRIEELEQEVSKSDPDAASKITKRDDEISWLRELLEVRHENLQDIITAVSSERYDRNAVKDAAIRLKANLQMEEQERERAMNGGSAINLPNIAQTIQAATPRVAQAVGPIAAAWGNWRKGNQSSFSGLSGVLSSPASGRNSTPSRTSPNPNNNNNNNNLLGGLLTPPASRLRQTPPVDSGKPQPTAFASTGRRYPSNGSAHISARARGISNTSLRTDMSGRGTPPLKHSDAEPRTPPMMPTHGYDSDAQLGDFDDQDFFEED